MATRTCRKAGARDKHTGDVETTPCSARGEEDRSKQAPGKTSRGTHGPARLNHPNPPPPERRQDTLKKNCKRKPPGGENLCRIPTKNHGATTTPKEKVREKKWEASSQAAALATHKGSRQPSGNRGGRTPKGEQPPSPLRAKPHSNIREAAVPEETRQVQDEPNRRTANAANLNWNEAKSSKSKSLGDRVSRETKRKPTGRNTRTTQSTEEHPRKHLHQGSDHSNQEAISQHSDRQARKASPQC